MTHKAPGNPEKHVQLQNGLNVLMYLRPMRTTALHNFETNSFLNHMLWTVTISDFLLPKNPYCLISTIENIKKALLLWIKIYF